MLSWSFQSQRRVMGSTTLKQKSTPVRKRAKLTPTPGSTRPFSFSVSAGRTKSARKYSSTGKEMTIPA